MRRFFAAFQDQSVSALDGERRELGKGVGTGLEDDETNPNRARSLLQDQGWRARRRRRDLSTFEDAAETLVLRRDGADTRRELRNLAILEDEALGEGVGDLAFGRLDVRLVRRQDLRYGMRRGFVREGRGGEGRTRGRDPAPRPEPRTHLVLVGDQGRRDRLERRRSLCRG